MEKCHSLIRGLYGIVDNTPAPTRSPLWLAEQFLLGGVKILQLRMKGGGRERVRGVAEEIVSLKKRFDFTFILNDWLDLVSEVGADGYHGGVDDPSPLLAREKLGEKKIIGYSSHSLEEAKEAEKKGADYVAFGAIFPSPLKGAGHPVQGVEKLREVVATLRLPVVAIGGICRDNVESVRTTGVASVALISGLVLSPHPSDEAKWYQEKLWKRMS